MAGCSFYVFGLFVKPLEAEFGWSRAQIMGASTGFALLQGACSILVGRLMRNYSTKLIIIAGSIIIGFSITPLSTITSIWQMYVLYSLSGVGFAAIGFVPATSLVLSWFRKKRGTMIGIVTAGIGAGGFIMPLIVGNTLIPSLGWRNTFLIIGLLPAIILIPLTLLLVKQRPEDMGLLPDNEKLHPRDKDAITSNPIKGSIESGLSLKQASQTGAFWLIAITSPGFGIFNGNCSYGCQHCWGLQRRW
jgi:sugar phosphate permease